jgi:hypothetical protein
VCVDRKVQRQIRFADSFCARVLWDKNLIGRREYQSSLAR